MKTVEATLEGLAKACPIRDVLDRLGDRWTMLVIVELLKGTRRFTELRRGIPDISPRMLSQTLRQLEQDGLVSRSVHPTIPPRVDYAMTPLGQSFVEALNPMIQWAVDHRQEVLKARTSYRPPEASQPVAS